MLKVYISESRNGKGVFASRDLKPGERILKITGKLLSFQETVDLGDLESYPIQVNSISERESYLMPDPPIFYLNHGCHPAGNVFINPKMELIAIKKIPKNHEIIYDYSLSMNEGGHWSLEKCNCGSIHYRGSAQDFTKLSPSLQRELVSKGLVMSHIYKDLDESPPWFVSSP